MQQQMSLLMLQSQLLQQLTMQVSMEIQSS